MSLFGTSASGAGGSLSSGTSAKALFGAPAASTTGTSLFGATTTTAAATPSLFGATTTTTAPTTGGLFGSTTAPAATTTGSIFGAPATTTTTAPATGSLFGAAAPAATTGGLFGSTAAPTVAAATTGGLFGAPATTTAPTPATGSLFGAAAPAATTATPSLFGSTATPAAATTTTGGLFGAPATTTTAAPATGPNIFGSSTPATTTTLGLGGTQQKLGTTTTGGTTTTSLTIGGEKEIVKDGEIPGAAQIRELLPLVEARLKKNREIIEDVENTTIDNSPLTIDEMIDKTRTWINESSRNVREASDVSTYVASLVADDKQFLETAKKLQDASTTSNQATLCNTIKSHIFELTDCYDSQMCQMQKRVEGINMKFERLLNGESALTMDELDDMFKRCDQSYANAQYHIHETGREIEALKNVLIEQGYTHLRKTYPQYSTSTTASTNEGAEFFPSQSSLAVIGSSLRAAPAATTATSGLGLGTTGGLFGSTGTTSLFGSTNTAATTASKSLFGSTTTTGGGSLFGNLTNPVTSTTTSTAAAPSTTTPLATSSTSLFGAKTAPTSTVTNNSSGLLFSMKK